MIRKHISKPIKKWVKQKLKNTYLEIESQDHKFKYSTYFQYQNGSDYFVIMKSKEEYDKCELGLPIPPENLWLGYGKDKKEYLYGKQQVDKMIELIKCSGFIFSDKKRILDFGCGAGRMIRWLKPLADTCEIWGTDISADHIYWANQYLKPPFNFAITTIIPHLPFEDKYFDLIYAGSVFTHIDDLTNAWLLELRRVLNTEGRLYITIQDKHSIQQLETSAVYKQLWITKYVQEELLLNQNERDFEMLVGGRGPESQVFYDIDFFCDSIKSIYEVLSINNNAYGFQTGILLKRK